MRLFGRSKPLHRRLAEAAGLSLDGLSLDGGGAAQAPGLPAAPPGFDGEQRGEPGIHGVPRPRRWDAVATADAPGVLGESVAFVVLPDGTVLVDDDQPEAALVPLADAVEARLPPPYRAEAVRRGPETWAVAARRIVVAEQRGLDGEEAELVSRAGERRLVVDGLGVLGRAPALEAAGERAGADYVVRATRLDGDLWEVSAAPL
ncbi:MAG TPA: hypothetical protein VHC01_01595 [Gaiellaceae bacterium]|nr:hypothetical protein [Gaiellaceae bacterium]